MVVCPCYFYAIRNCAAVFLILRYYAFLRNKEMFLMTVHKFAYWQMCMVFLLDIGITERCRANEYRTDLRI